MTAGYFRRVRASRPGCRLVTAAMSAVAAALFAGGCMLLHPKEEMASPNITPPGTVYTESMKAYLDISDPEMVIRYTLDGTLPDGNSPAYKEPLPINRSCKLTACGFGKDGRRGPPSEASFTKRMNPVKAKHVLLYVIDSMSTKMFEREKAMPLDGFRKLMKRGCLFKTVYTPLPIDPQPSECYPWNPSVPNPVLASGTALLGIPDLHKHLIQHKFDIDKELTAFTANSSLFLDNPENVFGHGIADGFKVVNDIQRQFEGKAEVMFRDDIVYYDIKKLLQYDAATFVHAHAQGPGSAGYEDNRKGNSIWDPRSGWFEKMLEADRWLLRLMEFLDTEKLWGETVVIVMGDNGQADTGWAPPYEEGSDCTLMIIAGRAVKEGGTFEYAEHADIAPTIAYLLGKDFPDYSQGRVLSEALCGYPDEQPAARWQKRLNDVQKRHHELIMSPEGMKLMERNHEFLLLNDGFETIDKIGGWHRRFPTVAAIAEHDEKLLPRLLEFAKSAKKDSAPGEK